MTDARLRDAERAAQASGTPESQAEWLRARVQWGELARERLELAAYCGDERARAVAGHCQQFACACGGDDEAHAHGPLTFAPFLDWTRGLARWGETVAVRAGVAAVRVAFPEHCRQHYGRQLIPRPGFFGGPTRLSFDATQPGHDVTVLENAEGAWSCYTALRAIEAAEAWCECPCEEHRWGVVARCQQTTSPGDWLWWLGQVLATTEAGDGDATHASVALFTLCARLAGEPAVREAVQRALIAWALR